MANTTSERPVIIGAGPGGLAAAWALKEAGLEPIVLEREQTACSSWQTYYPSLRMNSWRPLSSLPGRPLPREYGPWPMRDDFINYMREYVKALDADIRFGVQVQRLERRHWRWSVLTSEGEFIASHVVVATGLHRKPHTPDWPGLSEFRAEFLHARSYGDPEPFVGRDVLVVGCGPTGIDIAVELARRGASRVRIAIRHTPVLFKLNPFTSLSSQAIKHGRLPAAAVNWVSLTMHRWTWGDLTSYGLAPPTEGTLAGTARIGHAYGAIDRGLIPAVRSGAVEVVPGVAGFDGKAVLLDGGHNIKPDVVIAATGQRPDLEGLVGHLDTLSRPGGRPVVHGARTAPTAPNLYFQGYRLPPGQLPDMAVDARAIARAVTAGPLFDLGGIRVRRRARARVREHR